MKWYRSSITGDRQCFACHRYSAENDGSKRPPIIRAEKQRWRAEAAAKRAEESAAAAAAKRAERQRERAEREAIMAREDEEFAERRRQRAAAAAKRAEERAAAAAKKAKERGGYWGETAEAKRERAATRTLVLLARAAMIVATDRYNCY